MKYYKYKLNTVTLNIYALLLFVFQYIIVIYSFEFEYIRMGLKELLIVIGWFVLHELFHYVGFLCSKETKTKDLFLGIAIEKGIFYCMCKKKISRKDILVALVFPLFFIGIVTFIIGAVLSNIFLIFLSILNISGAIGDIVMTIQMLKLPSDIKYFDLDEPDAYYLLSKKDISNIKVSGIKLVESGEYDDKKMMFKNNRKILISKPSIVCLSILFIIIIVLLVL